MFIRHIEGAEKVMGSCTWMLIVLSVILTVIMLLFGKNILQLFGASNDTIIYAVDYRQWVFIWQNRLQIQWLFVRQGLCFIYIIGN